MSKIIHSTKCGGTRTFIHCWWACKTVHPVQETTWQLFKKLNICLYHGPYVTTLASDRCVHYLDCGDSVIAAYMSQNLSNHHSNYIQFIVCQLYLSRTVDYFNAGKSWHTPTVISQFKLPKSKSLGSFWVLLCQLHCGKCDT